MPLKNHPRLSTDSDWHSFHFGWAATITAHLNLTVLDADYAARPSCRHGIQAEVRWTPEEPLAIDPAAYRPPAPTHAAADLSHTNYSHYSVPVNYVGCDGRRVAVVELVSPSCATDADCRNSFLRRCAAHLDMGGSLTLVDVIPNREANLHDELVELLRLPAYLKWRSATGLSVVCYRTTQGLGKKGVELGDGKVTLDIWTHEVRVGDDLPMVPLWLASDRCVPLHLEAVFAECCQCLRIH